MILYIYIIYIYIVYIYRERLFHVASTHPKHVKSGGSFSTKVKNHQISHERNLRKFHIRKSNMKHIGNIWAM